MASKLLIQIQLYLLLAALTIVNGVVAKPNSPKFAVPNCSDTCGGVKIPYPFGMGDPSCFLDQWFEIDCKVSPYNKSNLNGSSNHKPFLSNLEFEVVYINYDGPKDVTVRIPPLNMCTTAHPQRQRLRSNDLSSSPFNFTYSNLFMMEGCPGNAVLFYQSNIATAGCGTVCHNNNNSAIPTEICFGVNCCQAPLIGTAYSYTSVQFYEIDFNLQGSGEAINCMVASLVDIDYVDEYYGKLSSSDLGSFPPVNLRWYWPSNLDAPQHYLHSSCFNDGVGLLCYCHNYFKGNPYVPNECTSSATCSKSECPQECEECRGYCLKTLSNKYYCENGPRRINLAAILGLGNSFGLLLLVACGYGLYRFIKRKREMKRRAKFFKRNGGLLLQQQLMSNKGIVETTKIFTISELEKATDHFNENRILGQGGQGTVYKGMLTDGSIVEIKKAKLLDESQLEQFINEVVILSRISHRHVVKLFGCCLETEVPLLVYEFIPNGTLYQHIHDPEEDFAVSWEMCLKIVADSAGAIAYLHSSSSIPIYHRDIKSSNILLDEKYRAKVSDFGSSKTIAMDQTHLTTLVQGTMGYLDPEYFRSYQFTDKSDVYSFGVVILELLTSKKPIYREGTSMEQKNLVIEFLFLTQYSRLSSILDPKIVGEAKEDELTSVVELAKRCVSWSGKLRPTMKEVAMTLEMIMKSPGQVSSWYQQQEDIAIQCAGYDEFDMGGVSDVEFIWTALPNGVASPPRSDECPFLVPT